MDRREFLGRTVPPVAFLGLTTIRPGTQQALDERRLMLYPLRRCDLLGILEGDLELDPAQLPPDSYITQWYLDYSREALVLVIASEVFQHTPQGEMPPWRDNCDRHGNFCPIVRKRENASAPQAPA